MPSFTEKPSLGVNFYECPESEFFLDCIGYNDFRYILPITALHVQEHYTLHYVLAGEGHLHIYGREYSVKAHDMFFIPPNTPMCYYPKEGDPWRYVWFSFTGKNAPVYQSMMGFSDTPVAACPERHEAVRLIGEVFSRLDADRSCDYHTALSLFYRLLSLRSSKESDSAGRLSDRVYSYLSCHYQNPYLTVGDLCRDFSVSHSYLARVFKEETGTTVIAALNGTRIEAAKKHLRDGELSVTAIGYTVGFSDHLHFMKVFKRTVGMTAKEYRLSSKAGNI